MIKYLIADLDNCLLNTSTMRRSILKSMLVLHKYHRGTQLIDLKENPFVEKDLHMMNPSDFARKYSITDEKAYFLRNLYKDSLAPPWTEYYDDITVLDDINLTKILITTGFRKLQLSKVEINGGIRYFKHIFIDAIDDLSKHVGKHKIFSRILEENNISPQSCLVLGDSKEAEIQAGIELGMITVQILRENLDIEKADSANHHIKTLHELPKIIASYNHNNKTPE